MCEIQRTILQDDQMQMQVPSSFPSIHLPRYTTNTHVLMRMCHMRSPNPPATCLYICWVLFAGQRELQQAFELLQDADQVTHTDACTPHASTLRVDTDHHAACYAVLVARAMLCGFLSMSGLGSVRKCVCEDWMSGGRCWICK